MPRGDYAGFTLLFVVTEGVPHARRFVVGLNTASSKACYLVHKVSNAVIRAHTLSAKSRRGVIGDIGITTIQQNWDESGYCRRCGAAPALIASGYRQMDCIAADNVEGISHLLYRKLTAELARQEETESLELVNWLYLKWD